MHKQKPADSATGKNLPNQPLHFKCLLGTGSEHATCNMQLGRYLSLANLYEFRRRGTLGNTIAHGLVSPADLVCRKQRNDMTPARDPKQCREGSMQGTTGSQEDAQKHHQNPERTQNKILKTPSGNASSLVGTGRVPFFIFTTKNSPRRQSPIVG